MMENKESNICSVLPSKHSFTGCDTTSAFVKQGKIGLLRHVEKNESLMVAFFEPGKSTNIPDWLFGEFEKFVCSMYGKPKYTNVNKLRYNMVAKKHQSRSDQFLSCFDGIDLSLLPSYRGL